MDFYTGSLRPNMGPEVSPKDRTQPCLSDIFEFAEFASCQSLSACHLYDVLWVHLGLIEEDILPRSFLAWISQDARTARSFGRRICSRIPILLGVVYVTARGPERNTSTVETRLANSKSSSESGKMTVEHVP